MSYFDLELNFFKIKHLVFYPCQICPQFWHCVGFLSAKKANKPSGKKHIATIICHALKPPCLVNDPHLGHEIFAIILKFKINNLIHPKK